MTSALAPRMHWNQMNLPPLFSTVLPTYSELVLSRFNVSSGCTVAARCNT